MVGSYVEIRKNIIGGKQIENRQRKEKQNGRKEMC